MITAIKTTNIDDLKGLARLLPHPVGKRLKTIAGKFNRVFVISIIDNNKPAFIHNHKNRRILDAITISFNDDSHSFSPWHADKIRTFLDSLKTASDPDSRDLLIVQCTMGISRSGAVATFAADFLNVDRLRFQQINRGIRPNFHVLSTLKA